MAGDVFQHKLDQCFGEIRQVIVLADGLMIVGKKPNHSDNYQALTTLLETDRGCNVRVHYENLQYEKVEVDFSVKLTPQVVASLTKMKCQQLPRCLCQQARNKYSHL